MIKMKYETGWLDRAAVVKEIGDLDCMVCPDLKVKGGKRGVEIKCGHEALLVRVNVKPGVLPDWCPRKKSLEKCLEDIGGE